MGAQDRIRYIWELGGVKGAWAHPVFIFLFFLFYILTEELSLRVNFEVASYEALNVIAFCEPERSGSS